MPIALHNSNSLSVSVFNFNPAVAVVFVINFNCEVGSTAAVLYSNIFLLPSVFAALVKVKYLFKLSLKLFALSLNRLLVELYRAL